MLCRGGFQCCPLHARAVRCSGSYRRDWRLHRCPMLCSHDQTWGLIEHCQNLIDFLYQLIGRIAFPHTEALALARFVSNHKPILLKASCRRVMKMQFRMENYWLREEDFIDTVNKIWEIRRQEMSPMTRLISKLKHMTEELSKWGANKTPRQSCEIWVFFN